MQAILITPESHSIETIDIAGREDIAKLIGLDKQEDQLFFDEACFLCGTSGRFQADAEGFFRETGFAAARGRRRGPRLSQALLA